MNLINGNVYEVILKEENTNEFIAHAIVEYLFETSLYHKCRVIYVIDGKRPTDTEILILEEEFKKEISKEDCPEYFI